MRSNYDKGADTLSVPKKKKRGLRFALAALLLLLIAAVIWISPWGTVPTGVRHYLFVGKDNWSEIDDAQEGRTDAMLLITLDSGAKRISMTSFLRDTLVDMPSGGQNRLNTLARTYGDEALRAYIEETYAVDITGMFSINFAGAVQVIDALGGVTVDLTRAEVSYLRQAVGNYGATYTLRAGPCKLNGAQALGYMRCRKLDNDFGRTNRQANVLNALMQEARSMSLSQVLRAVPEVLKCYTTNLSLSEQLTLARGLFALRSTPLRRFQIPAEGTYRYTTVKGASMLKINVEKNQKLFAAFLSER